jgi:hypothetical protein
VRTPTIIRRPPFGGPCPPRPFEFPAQEFKTGEPDQCRSAAFAKTGEILFSRRCPIALEAAPGERECACLRFDETGIIDKFGLTKRCDLIRQSCGLQTGKFLDPLRIDVMRIEEQPAAGRIGTVGIGTIVEKRMQRVKPNPRCAKARGNFDNGFKIGEIAMAPIAP